MLPTAARRLNPPFVNTLRIYRVVAAAFNRLFVRPPRGVFVRFPIAIVFILVAGCGDTLAGPPIARAGAGSVGGQPIGGSELVSASVVGINRVCSYRPGAIGTRTRSYRIGLGQRCPAQFPTTDPHFPVPPTARLETVEAGSEKRNCIYAQGTGHWTVGLRFDQSCPLNAGLASKLAAENETPAEEERRRRPQADQSGAANTSDSSTQP